MNKFLEYKSLLNKEIIDYQKKLYNELIKNKYIIDNSIEVSLSNGKKTNKNDRSDYNWIRLTFNNKEYWLTLFYNELDETTGNMHTQIGRIQFCKDINKKTPNSYIKVNNKTVWYMNLDKYGEPKKGITYVGDNTE